MEMSDRSMKIVYIRKSISSSCKTRLKWIVLFLIIFIILCLLFVFIALPFIFMHSIALQRLLIFTNFGLPKDQLTFEYNASQMALRNFYITVKDSNTSQLLSLGVWHLIPLALRNASLTDKDFSYDEVLKNNSINILLYFHGTGESRKDSFKKYNVFRNNTVGFQVITFDYRSYADSSKGTLSEEAVVEDCVQLYEWLLVKSTAPIFIWGHSLGSALAARTMSRLANRTDVRQPAGLVLESAFTSMREELSSHPYGKIFAWLPYFEQTILDPLEKNKFLFETSKNILNVVLPIMVLFSEDDEIVSHVFGRKLCEIARNRTNNVDKLTYCYEFPYVFDYDHIFIYQDQYLPQFIKYFIYQCKQQLNLN